MSALPPESGLPSEPDYCRTPDDILGPAARALLGQLARPWLDQSGLAPVEVLYCGRHLQRFTGSANVFASLVQRIAILQVRRSRRPVGERVKELLSLGDALEAELRRQEKALHGSYNLGRDIDADTILRIETLLTMRQATMMVVALLDRAGNCAGKLDLLIDLQRRAVTALLKDVVDAVLAEILEAEAAAAALTGSGPPLQKIVNSLHLLNGNATLMVLPAADRPRAYALAGLLRQRGLPLARARLAARIGQLAAAAQPLAAADPATELRALLTLGRALPQIGDRHGQPGTDAALDATLRGRLSRLVNGATLETVLAAEAPDYGPRLLAALALHDLVSTGAAAAAVSLYIDALFERPDFETRFVAAPAQRAETIRRLRAAVGGSLLPAARKGALLMRLQTLAGEAAKLPGGSGATRSKAGPEDAVYIGEQRIPLLHWGPAGLVFGPVPAGIGIGRYIPLTVRIRNPFISIAFETEATLVRMEDRIVSARYEVWDNDTDRRIRRHFNQP